MREQAMNTSRFFTDLPAELRTEIYTYAYATSRKLPRAWESETCSRRPEHKSWYRGVDGLLVCRQWFAESYDIALRNGTWTVDDWFLLFHWIKRLTKRAEHARQQSNTLPALYNGTRYLEIPHAMTALRVKTRIHFSTYVGSGRYDPRFCVNDDTLQKAKPLIPQLHSLAHLELAFDVCMKELRVHGGPARGSQDPRVTSFTAHELSTEQWARVPTTLILVSLLAALPALRTVVFDARVWCGLGPAEAGSFETYVVNAVNFGSALEFHLGHKEITVGVRVNKFGGISERMQSVIDNTNVEVERCEEAPVCRHVLDALPSGGPLQYTYWYQRMFH